MPCPRVQITCLHQNSSVAADLAASQSLLASVAEVEDKMASVWTYIRRFALIMIVIIIIVSILNFAFGTLLPSEAAFLGLQITTRQVIQLLLVGSAGVIVLLLIRRFAKGLRRIVGPYIASVFSYILVMLDAFAVVISILEIMNVPASSLLLGGSLGAIIIGLAVSTLFGNIFSGALVLFAKPVVVGDEVLVNNIPGRIEEISTLFMKIANESGTETILPNSALVSGAVTLTRVASKSGFVNRLPFEAGDRIYTSYVGGEGMIKQVDPLYMTVVLDDGREIKIPNNGIMTGAISIALVNAISSPKLKLSVKISWDVERAIKAMQAEAITAPELFKSPLQVLYSSLDDGRVGLEVTGEVDAKRVAEAKSRLLRAAYLAKDNRSSNDLSSD